MPRKILVNLNNPIGTWVQKTNAMSDYLGDLDDLDSDILASGQDSNIVATINHVHDLIDSLNQSLFGQGGTTYLQMNTTSINADSAVFRQMQADSMTTTLLTADSGTINNIASQNINTGSLIADSAQITRLDMSGGDSTSVILPPNSIDGTEIDSGTISKRNLSNLIRTDIRSSTGAVLKTLYTPGN